MLMSAERNGVSCLGAMVALDARTRSAPKVGSRMEMGVVLWCKGRVQHDTQ